LAGKTVSGLLRIYFEFNQLKLLYRQGWLRRGIPTDVCESVAEHTLGVAFLALLILESDPEDSPLPAPNPLKVLRMALLHDLGEIHAGDLTPADAVETAEKHRLERESLERVLGGLPDGEAYLALWDEYEAGASAEARFVRQLDRLEMGLQAGIYRQMGYSGLNEFFASAAQGISEPALRALLAEVEQLG
jgi:putative hydrolase of HD superfamily